LLGKFVGELVAVEASLRVLNGLVNAPLGRVRGAEHFAPISGVGIWGIAGLRVKAWKPFSTLSLESRFSFCFSQGGSGGRCQGIKSSTAPALFGRHSELKKRLWGGYL